MVTRDTGCIVTEGARELGEVAGEITWTDGESRMAEIMERIAAAPVEDVVDRGARDALTWLLAGAETAHRVRDPTLHLAAPPPSRCGGSLSVRPSTNSSCNFAKPTKRHPQLSNLEPGAIADASAPWLTSHDRQIDRSVFYAHH
jgi:hypothetical protein